MSDIEIDVVDVNSRLKQAFGVNFMQNLNKETIKAFNTGINATIADIISTANMISKEAYTARSKKYQTKRKRATRMIGGVRFSGKPGYGLYHFKPQPKKITTPRPSGGVTTQIRRGGSRSAQRIPGYTAPFVAGKRQGGYALFARRKGGKRKDIMYLLGPSTIQAITRGSTREILKEQGEREFLNNVAKSLNDMLAGVK